MDFGFTEEQTMLGESLARTLERGAAFRAVANLATEKNADLAVHRLPAGGGVAVVILLAGNVSVHRFHSLSFTP